MRTALRLSLDEYHAMIARGAFSHLRGRHIELIHGELREMAPQGPWHSETLTLLDEWTTATVGRAVRKRLQMPLSIGVLDSEPEPDLVWAKPKSYSTQHPSPDDVLLLVEVSYSTLDADLGENAELYAQAGIADYWVVDLVNRTIHVFRQPSLAGYAVHERVPESGSVRPLCFPHVELAARDVFPA